MNPTTSGSRKRMVVFSFLGLLVWLVLVMVFDRQFLYSLTPDWDRIRARVSNSKWVELGSGTNNTVWAMASFNDRLAVGGYFDSAGASEAESVAQWDGENWSDLGVQADGNFVRALEIYNGELTVAIHHNVPRSKSFGVGYLRNGRWYLRGGTGEESSVHALATFQGTLVAAGQIYLEGDYSRSRLLQWDNSKWISIGAVSNRTAASVWCLESIEGNLYAGGQFNSLDKRAINNIARWDGKVWSPLGDGIGGVIRAITSYEGAIIAGGRFDTADGVPATNIAAWDGTTWKSLGEGLPGYSLNGVQCLANYKGELFAAGDIMTRRRDRETAIAKWNGEDWSVVARVDGQVMSMIIHNGKLVAAGSFRHIDGKQVNCIAVLED